MAEGQQAADRRLENASSSLHVPGFSLLPDMLAGECDTVTRALELSLACGTCPKELIRVTRRLPWRSHLHAPCQDQWDFRQRGQTLFGNLLMPNAFIIHPSVSDKHLEELVSSHGDGAFWQCLTA